jgi:hypothetical protein
MQEKDLLEEVRGLIVERENALIARFAPRSGKGDRADVVEEMVEAIVGLIRRSLAPIAARLRELESQPFRYDGTYESGKHYARGTFVTHAGGLWHCNLPTESKPGTSDHWTLAVKSGDRR